MNMQIVRPYSDLLVSGGGLAGMCLVHRIPNTPEAIAQEQAHLAARFNQPFNPIMNSNMPYLFIAEDYEPLQDKTRVFLGMDWSHYGVLSDGLWELWNQTTQNPNITIELDEQLLAVSGIASFPVAGFSLYSTVFDADPTLAIIRCDADPGFGGKGGCGGSLTPTTRSVQSPLRPSSCCPSSCSPVHPWGGWLALFHY